MVIVTDNSDATWIILVLQVGITTLDANVQNLLASNSSNISGCPSIHNPRLSYQKKNKMRFKNKKQSIWQTKIEVSYLR